MTETQGWQKRNVRYENIHSVQQADFDKLMESLELTNSLVVGDFMAGYGAVTREICKYANEKKLDLSVVLNDRFPAQLERSRQELSDVVGSTKLARCQSDIRNLCLSADQFDRVAIKMGLHELPRHTQQSAVNEVYRVLKPGGLFAVWGLLVNTAEEQDLFNKIIRKKDELASFQSLARERYFYRQEELENYMAKAGFREITVCHEMTFKEDTLKRLDEFQSDSTRLQAYNDYIRQIMPDYMKPRLSYEDKGNAISLAFRLGIMKAEK